MIVKIINGKTTAEAETVSEIRLLLSYMKMVEKRKAKYKKSSIEKVPCPKCGKKVKYLNMHEKVMHGEGRLLGSVYGEIATRN